MVHSLNVCVCLWWQFKEELMASMGLNTEEEGSPMAFFRRGYKVRPSFSALM